MIDEVESTRFIEAVRQGLREADLGRGRPAEEVFAEMQVKYGDRLVVPPSTIACSRKRLFRKTHQA